MGCQSHQSPAEAPQQASVVAEDLADRYAAASQIWNLSDKDVALRKIAMDAAGENVPEWALRATGEISNLALKDETASKCALQFNDRGNRKTAMKLAGMISDPSIRDDVMQHLSAVAAPAST